MVKFLYTAEDKKQRARIITITVIAAAIILGLTTWAIIAITTSGDRKVADETLEPVATVSNDAPVVEVIEAPSVPETKTETKTEEAKPEATAKSEAKTETKTETKPEIKPASNVPETGPLDIIPIALIAGSITAYIGSCILVNQKNRK